MESANRTADAQTSQETEPRSSADSTTIPESAEQLAAERDQIAKEKRELQDLLQRRQAEFENFRRRVEREKTEVFEYAGMDTVESLLPILDDFERATKVESADKEYARGMELIYQRFYDVLKKLGLQPVPSDTQFDPHIHHAVEMIETDEQPDHTILEEYFKGRLLRPAMVKVAVKR